MVSKITVSILALIGWDLLEWTGDEGKLLKLGELWAIKRSVLRRPLPLMREKKRCELSVVVSLGGERGQCVLSVAMMDLRWLRYGQSGPRTTSAGFAMIKVSLERVQLDLVPIPLQANQRYRDGAYLLIASVWLFPTFLPKACLSGKIALASGRLALLSALASACSSWWAEQMECHAAVVCVSIRLIEQVLRSLW